MIGAAISCRPTSRRSTNVGLAFGQRRRRWVKVKPTLVERLVGRLSCHTYCQCDRDVYHATNIVQ